MLCAGNAILLELGRFHGELAGRPVMRSMLALGYSARTSYLTMGARDLVTGIRGEQLGIA